MGGGRGLVCAQHSGISAHTSRKVAANTTADLSDIKTALNFRLVLIFIYIKTTTEGCMYRLSCKD